MSTGEQYSHELRARDADLHGLGWHQRFVSPYAVDVQAGSRSPRSLDFRKGFLEQLMHSLNITFRLA